jgi:cell division protein FtsI/penicillin-binding protein 2
MNARDPYLMPRYMRQFGLGVSTGITDIREDPGAVGDPDTLRIKYGNTWTFADAARVAIGQGEVEITPLQFARLTAAIANGGTLYQPRLVRQAGLFDDFSYVMEPNANGELGVSDHVLDIIHEGMCNVITASYGTASHIFRDSRLLDVGVCGKTGTAQDLTGTGRRPHAWFIAYSPKADPEIAITVVVENVGDGSAFAAPITRRILEYYYFGTEPIATVSDF